MSVKDKLKYILAIPKIIFFNLKMLPLAQAIYLPIFISNDTKIYGCYRGAIHLNGKISIGTVRMASGREQAGWAIKRLLFCA